MILSLRLEMQMWAAWPSSAWLSSSQRACVLGMTVDSDPSSAACDCAFWVPGNGRIRALEAAGMSDIRIIWS